jgi:hypothetical protein
LTCGPFEDQDRCVRRVGVDGGRRTRIMIGVSIVEPPSYEQLALFVVELTGRLDGAPIRLDEAAARIAVLEAEVAALRARLGKDSTNSSTPPSADSPGAKAEGGHVAAGAVQGP